MESVDNLLSRIEEMLGQNNVSLAVELFDEFELAVAEEGFAPEYYAQSYCLYMLSLLLNGSLLEARHLWQRSGDALKDRSTSSFADIYQIANALLHGNSSEAARIIDGIAWEESLSLLAGRLRASIVEKRLVSLGTHFRDIRIDYAASSLHLSPDAVSTEIISKGWQVDPSSQIVTIDNSKKMSEESVDSDRLLQGGLVAEQLSTYVASLQSQLVSLESNAKATGAALPALARSSDLK